LKRYVGRQSGCPRCGQQGEYARWTGQLQAGTSRSTVLRWNCTRWASVETWTRMSWLS